LGPLFFRQISVKNTFALCGPLFYYYYYYYYYYLWEYIYIVVGRI
jgi:hypothetical protein